MDFNDPVPWLALGLIGQAVFGCRFLVQWVVSERAGRSYVPMSFWYLSLLGSAALAAYAIHREEPVFLLGYLPNSFVYVRNIVLLRRRGMDASPSGAPDAPVGPS